MRSWLLPLLAAKMHYAMQILGGVCDFSEASGAGAASSILRLPVSPLEGSVEVRILQPVPRFFAIEPRRQSNCIALR